MPKSLMGARNRSMHVRNLGRRSELSHRRVPKRWKQSRRAKLLMRCSRIVPALPAASSAGHARVAAKAHETTPAAEPPTASIDVSGMDGTTDTPPSESQTSLTTTQLVQQLRSFATARHWLPETSRTTSMTVLTRLVDVALQRRQLCIADLCAHLQQTGRPLGALAEQWLETRRTMASLTHFVYMLGRPLDLVLRLHDGQSIAICRLVRVCPYTANLKIRDIAWLVGAETEDQDAWSKRVTLDRYHTSIMSLLAQRLPSRALCALVLGYAYEDALPLFAHEPAAGGDATHATLPSETDAATQAWVLVPPDGNSSLTVAAAAAAAAPVSTPLTVPLPLSSEDAQPAQPVSLPATDSWWNWLGLSRIW